MSKKVKIICTNPVCIRRCPKKLNICCSECKSLAACVRTHSTAHCTLSQNKCGCAERKECN